MLSEEEEDKHVQVITLPLQFRWLETKMHNDVSADQTRGSIGHLAL
jgi:hypothetical protein